MVAIIITVKELYMMIASNPHTQCLSLSHLNRSHWGSSPFSSEPAPTGFLLPSLCHFGAVKSRCVGWSWNYIRCPNALLGVREEGGCVLCSHLVCITCSLSGGTEKEAMWFGGSSRTKVRWLSSALCGTQRRAALRSSNHQPPPSPEAALAGRKEGKKAPVVGPAQAMSVALGKLWARSGELERVMSS